MKGVIAVLTMLCGGAALAAPIVIAHRGASGYLPEHTLAAYALGYGMGADYIEPDLVLTKDGRFICLHDIHLEATTNAAEAFPERKRADGKWYAADFTLAEIKTLEARERVEGRFPQGRSPLTVPTFEEAIELVQGLNRSTGRTVGLYPELKAPGWHRDNDLPMEAALMAVLERYGYTEPTSAIFVQSFEQGALQTLRELGCRVPLIQNMGASRGALATPEGLASVATYANGIGPSKGLIEKHPEIVAEAKALGLLVHVYTMREDDVPDNYADGAAELRTFFFDYGVDGVWTDHPDVAVRVRAEGR